MSMEPKQSSGASEADLLVSTAEREQSLALLRGAAADGRLSLEEFSERSEAALSARTRGELRAVTQDIAPVASGSAATSRAPATRVSNIVAILGSNRRAKRWRAQGRLNAVALLGECVIDLRQAEIIDGEIELNAVALLGSIELIAPPGVRVELSALPLLGSSEDERGDETDLPNAPVVRVRGASVLGSIRVTSGDGGEGPWDPLARRRARGLRHAERRARRAEQRMRRRDW